MSALLSVEAVIRELKQPKLAEKSLTFLEVRSGYRPGWSLASSFVVQLSVIALVSFVALIPTRITSASRLQFVSTIDVIAPNRVVYLPSIGGGSEGNRAGAHGNARESSATPVRSSKGFSYPGQQAIVSDPPQAFNPTQTLLQPALKNAPALQDFVPLPNVVEMTNAGPDPSPARIIVKPSKARVAVVDPVAPSMRMQAPKLTLPIATTSAIPALSVADPPTLPEAEKPQPPPVVEFSQVPMRGPDARNLLSLSAVPAPPELPAKFPAAEARGRFAISPDPIAPVSQPGPGAGGVKSGADNAGIGNVNDTLAADAASMKAAAAGSAAGASGKGPGDIAANGTGKGNGSGDGGSGISIGRGSGAGVGIGGGTGPSSASGSGSGNGGGSGSFAGITIQGGRYSGGSGANLHPTLAQRTAYGMTIISTATSGGGLADFGVFSNEKVYTVFMDMRENADERVPAWTLQYAPVSRSGNAFRGAVVAPSPLIRPRPQLPTPLLHKYAHAVVVISALLGTAGHLEEISVKQTPDAQLIPAILAALNNWSFQPAEVDGKAVPIKILLGIPLQ